jgi:hypothetical protein
MYIQNVVQLEDKIEHKILLTLSDHQRLQLTYKKLMLTVM